MVALLALTFAGLLTAGQTAPATGVLTGRIVEEGTGAPVPGARVLLMSTRRPDPVSPPSSPQVADATSDPQGRFVFDNVPPGRYQVNVQKSGFATQSGPGQPPPAPVDVVAGRTTEIERQLQRGAVIIGRVLDASGEPVADARVMAMRRMDSAERLFPTGQGAQTNDLGEFRLFGLPSGNYYVQASPRPEFGGPGPRPARSAILAPTYYPGVVDSAAAQSLVLGPGQVSDSISITLQVVPAFSLSGVVVDETGAPVDGAMIWVMLDRAAGPMMGGPPGQVRSDSSGRFTVPNLQAGRYQVTAGLPVVLQSAGAASGGSVGGGFSTFSSGGVGGIAGGAVMTESRGGITTQFRMDDAGRVVVDVSADVAGIRVTARRPSP